MSTFTPDLSQYPEVVQYRTTLYPEVGWIAFADLSLGRAEVHYHGDTGYGFSHEMGHAAAYILGIEGALALLVMKQPGAQNPRNENIFCYGAQQLEVHDWDRAMAEYAATAIQYYTDAPGELPRPVFEFIRSAFEAAKGDTSVQ